MSLIVHPGQKPGMQIVPDGNGGVVLVLSAPTSPELHGKEIAFPRDAAWRLALAVLFLVRCPESILSLVKAHSPDGAQDPKG